MFFTPLNPSQITPTGWLKNQLKVQADGLSGNLDKIWPDVADSKWLGGEHEGWERLPYFLDGFIPLSFLLRDEDKIARARRMVDAILDDRAEDGCFYPKGDEGKRSDIWSVFLITKMLTVYADCAGEEERILPPLKKCLRFLNKLIDCNPPAQWGASRWFECLVAIKWVYDREPEEWLIRLARRLRSAGFRYEETVKLWDRPADGWSFDTHVVNVAMAFKCDALFSELTGDKPTGLADTMFETLEKHHGTAYGHFNGDECLAGDSPVQGSELCGVVEAMYSYEWLAAITGEGKWGERLEALAFNGLPAAVSEDMWTHQYDQCVNQIACIQFEKPVYTTNFCDANVFGLEPTFGCCTANFSQGFPKFALSAYMKKDERLVILSPVPEEIAFGDGVVTVESEYPFRLSFTVRATADTPVLLRLPAWAEPSFSSPAEIRDGYAAFTVPANGSVTVTYRTEPRLVSRPEERVALKYGALLFALPLSYVSEMQEYESSGVTRKFPYCDYYIRPTSPWQYAFTDAPFEVIECPTDYKHPFSRTNPPVKIRTKLCPIRWDEERPMIPSVHPTREKTGEPEIHELQPYGATTLRITETVKVSE